MMISCMIVLEVSAVVSSFSTSAASGNHARPYGCVGYHDVATRISAISHIMIRVNKLLNSISKEPVSYCRVVYDSLGAVWPWVWDFWVCEEQSCLWQPWCSLTLSLGLLGIFISLANSGHCRSAACAVCGEDGWKAKCMCIPCRHSRLN